MNKEIKLCAAFKDLYPSYLEDMVEEETKKWMEGHLDKCEQCRHYAESYKKSSKVEEVESDKAINTKVYEEDKKVIKRARIILTAGMAAIVLLAIWTSIWILM